MKFIKYIYAVALASVMVGCNDSFLDRAPKDKLSDVSFWKTEQDAVKYSNGIYRYLVQPENHTIMTDCYTDNAVPVHVGAEQGQLSAGTASSTNKHFAQLWNDAYAGIRRCLVFYAHIDEVDMDNAQKEEITAEVNFLEAFFYSTLLKYMGGVPVLDKPLALTDEKPARKSADEVLDYIFGLLDKAAAKLPVIRGEAEHGKPTSAACHALKSRMAYYAHKYDVAADEAKKVMETGKYALADDYVKLFQPESEFSNEIIFDKEYVKNASNSTEGNLISLFFMPVAFGAWEALSPTQDLVDAYPCKDGLSIKESPLYNPENPYENRDPRLAANILWPGAKYPVVYNGKMVELTFSNEKMNDGSHTRTGYSMRKYLNPEDFGINEYGNTNFIYLRYAEVLLTFAESKNELDGPTAEVYSAVNQVRQRKSVNLPPLKEGLSKDDMRKAIRLERRLEMAFEGVYLFDTRSWKTTEECVTKPVYGVGKNMEKVLVEKRSFNPKRDYLWAIPNNEIDLSKGALKQNPGWE